MDTILILSIFLVFFTALIGSFVQRRKRDRVLADLDGFHTSVKLKDDTQIWGRMSVFPNGLELVYARPYKNHRGHINTSYILFRDSMDSIAAIYRYHSELSPVNQKLRLQEVRRISKPGLWRRFYRHLFNFFNTFRDAINESMGMLLTRMKGTSTSILFKTQDERLRKIGAQALGAVGNAYDTILERYIGRRVVIELTPDNGEKEEYCGVLKEYSPSWIAILDCHIADKNSLPLADIERLQLQRDMEFKLSVATSEKAMNGIEFSIKIRSHSEQPIRIKQIQSNDYQHVIDTTLNKGESLELTLNDLPRESIAEIDTEQLPCELILTAPGQQTDSDKSANQENPAPCTIPALHLHYESIREVDIYVPRTVGTVRHGAEFIY